MKMTEKFQILNNTFKKAKSLLNVLIVRTENNNTI